MFNFNKNKQIVQQVKHEPASAEFFLAKNTYNFTDPYISETKNSYGYIFGQGNLYPQELLRLYSSSPIHSASINFKRILISGNGVEYDKTGLDTGKLIASEQLNYLFNENIEGITSDLVIHNRFYLEITWNSDFTKIIKIKRLPAETIRIAELDECRESFIFNYCWDWKQVGRFGLKQYPKFDCYNKKDRVQLFEYQCDTPGKKIYTLPSYRSCLEWVTLDSEMGIYHKANITNSLNPSLLIKFYNQPDTEEKKRAIRDSLESSFAGSANAGRCLTIFNADKDSAPDVTQLEPNKLDKTFIQLTDTIQRQVLYAHNVNPDLLGLKTPGSLGTNAGQLDSLLKQFIFTSINPNRKIIENVFNLFAALNGITNKFSLTQVQY